MIRSGKWMIAAMVMSAPVVALANEASVPRLECPAGSVQVGGPGTHFEASLCAKKDSGTFHGPYVLRHRNGKPQASGQYEDGFRTGRWVFFDETGLKTGETEFKRGDFDGRRVEYHPNGHLKLEETYFRGKREGLAREFDPAGKILKLSEYRANQLVVTR